MAKGSLNIVELHIEKIVLGVAVLFAGYMVWMFVVGSPNTVEYNGQEYGPTTLHEAIKQNAQQLETAVRNAKPPEQEDDPELEKSIVAAHQEGVLAPLKAAPLPNTAELPVATVLGQKIEVPGLEAFQETPRSVALTKPLAPMEPVAVAGWSVAVRERPELATDETSRTGRPAGNVFTVNPTRRDVRDQTNASAAEPVSWVTVGAYFDTDAQQKAFEDAGYPPFRARPYVVGMDVQRQEKLANGTFSDWSLVTGSKAMPELDVPEPELNPESDELSNKQALDEAFATIKASQSSLKQPGFFEVVAGDEWIMPPLTGWEDAARQALNPIAKAPKGPKAPKEPEPTNPIRNPGRDRGGAQPIGVPPRTPRPTQPQGPSPKKQIDDDIDQARQAMRSGDYQEAKRLAEQVARNSNASRNQIRQAERIVDEADAEIAKGGGAGAIIPGSRFPGMATDNTASRLITHPDEDYEALWFNDDTVEPGKTYRYRTRVKLWNRYVGQGRLMKDRAQATQAVISGEWSEPTPEVWVAPDTVFFVKSASFDKPEIRVEVYKRIGDDEPQWVSSQFDVRAGDEIGGMSRVKIGDDRREIDFSTGAVALAVETKKPVLIRDERRGEIEYREMESAVLTYVNPFDGQVLQQNQAEDRASRLREKLESLADS